MREIFDAYQNIRFNIETDYSSMQLTHFLNVYHIFRDGESTSVVRSPWPHYGVCGPSMESVAPLWSLWPHYGVCGPIMESVAQLWSMWPRYGVCGSFMESVAPLWNL